jgi:hypothetical protein
MKLLLFIAIIVSIILAFPYARFIFKRFVLIVKLKNLCIKNNAKLYINNLLSPFSSIHNTKCDLYIETQYEILSIKLFGINAKPYYITFKPDRKYQITRFFIVPGVRGSLVTPFDSKDFQLPVYKFDHKIKKQWKFKTLRKILLINPVSMDFKVNSPNSQGYLCDGDFINGMEAFSYQGLKKKIFERGL